MSQLCNSSNKTATCAVLQQKCYGHLFSEAAGRSRAASSLLSRLGFLSTSCPRAQCEAESKQPVSLDEPIIRCFNTVLFVTEQNRQDAAC